MREFFERLLVSATPASRVLLAVWSSTPFFVIVLVLHGWALLTPVVSASLHTAPMWGLQALITLCVLVNVALAWWVWPRRHVRHREDVASLMVCLSIGVGYTAITILAGTFTAGTNLVLIGVLAIGLLLFPMRIMVVAYVVCASMLLVHDLGVLLAGWSYAPALSQGMFVDDRPMWWFAAWREYVFYAGYGVLMYLLLLLFGRLDEIHASLTQLSHTDELTGLSNRRRFMAALQSELTRRERNGLPMCVALLDADHFKLVNDRHGHHAGDEVLRTLSAIMLGTLRTPTDIAARLGGEEFALLLPQTRLEDAQRVCERLRSTVAAQRFKDGEHTFQISISIGLVEAPGADVNAEAVLVEADRQLYQAKSAGRNRVCSRLCVPHTMPEGA